MNGTDVYNPSQARIEHDWLVEKARERFRATNPIQGPLPFGDGFLGDDELVPEIHGTALGVRRHLAAGEEDLCSLCTGWVAELVAAGYATTPTGFNSEENPT